MAAGADRRPVAAADRLAAVGRGGVAAGGTHLHAPLAAGCGPAGAAGWRLEAIDEPQDLTPREQQILQLMSWGLSNREIAAALRLGEGTVRNHVPNILSKLGVSDRTRAVLYALERRLV